MPACFVWWPLAAAAATLVAAAATESTAFVVAPRVVGGRSLGATCNSPLFVQLQGRRCPDHFSAARRRRLCMGEFEEEERVRKLREMLTKQMGGKGSSPKAADEWCEPTNVLAKGTVLIADPAPFQRGEPAFLSRFAFNEAIPNMIPADRRAELLPVVLLLDHGPGGSAGLVLNRRTGMLMGDLGNGDEMRAFSIQPLWQGGTSGQMELAFLHTYGGEIADSQPVTEDGLSLGGDFSAACRHVTEGAGSGFNFRFIARYTQWRSGELEKEVALGRWHPAKAGKMSLIKPRDRQGPEAARPMWTDLLRMAGGDYQKVQEAYYGDS